MRWLLNSSIAILLLTGACSPKPPAAPPDESPAGRPVAVDTETLLARGRGISSQAFALLSSNLLAAIQQSGVSNALPFCSALAMPLTDIVAHTNDVSLRRVSHRPRNPANRANPAELEWIEEYRATLAAGGKGQPFLVTNDTIAFYAPIVIANRLCLQCHGKPGDDIAPANLEVIRRLYPGDEATGFGLGDVRGLWRIEFRRSSNTKEP